MRTRPPHKNLEAAVGEEEEKGKLGQAYMYPENAARRGECAPQTPASGSEKRVRGPIRGGRRLIDD